MPRRSPGPDATVPPSMLWPLLCSALLVGIMVTGRCYTRLQPATPEDQGARDRRLRRSRAALTSRTVCSAHGPPSRAAVVTPGAVANPWKGWKDIFWRTYQQIGEDRLLAVAAGVVFYGLLAVFPAVTALVSLYGLFASPAAISEQLALLSGILPDSAVEILREQIGRLTANSSKLGLGFIFGLAVALWSANSGMKAIMDALNVVYEEKEKRGFIKLNLISLAFTLAGIGVLLLALGTVVVLPIALNYLGLHNATDLLLRLARWPLLIVIVIFGLAVLYRYGPSRREPRWQWISVGSVLPLSRGS